MAEDRRPPTLAQVAECASELATELAGILAALPDDLGAPAPRPVRILRNQTAALRAIEPHAEGFWARRQSWSLGQTAVVVVPVALRGIHDSVAPVDASTRERCAELLARLADVLERHASERPQEVNPSESPRTPNR